MREYTPEYETFRDDAMAVLSGSAVTIAVAGFWTKPLFMGPIALLVALLGYFLTPRSKGSTLVAVIVITLLALVGRWLSGYAVA
ncbi:MAG: hypothetical protein QOG33_1991 [Gaiellales bacterium]|nr:hypothetical protein [Gaiellales bacterium]